jgi:glycosidase
MQLLTAYLMSVPGIPCVYYGDEIADVGGNDPDNRRMMRFDGLNEQETQTREWLGTWASMRRSRMSMTYGTTSWNEPQDGLLHIERTYLTESTHVVLNRTGTPLPLPSGLKQPKSLLAGSMTDDGMVPPYGAIAFGDNTQP